jgi:hypothetical protein
VFRRAGWLQWSHNRGHIAQSSIFAKPIARDTITETTEQFIDPPLKVEGVNKDLNLSSTWVASNGDDPAGSSTWRNSANMNSSEILSGHG